jgi:glycosyltransferase involved in cell wall biosynthesis
MMATASESRQTVNGNVVPLRPGMPKPALALHSRVLNVGMLVGSTTVGSGGVSEAVRALCLALYRTGEIRPRVFSLEDDASPQRSFGPIPVHLARRRGPLSFGFAPELAKLVKQHAPDVVHLHGLWMYPSVVSRQWGKKTGKPYVVSPHGMLDPWALQNSGWKKRLALRLFETSNIANAACLHALCESEKDAIALLGRTTPVVVLPNGIEKPIPVSGVAEWRKKLPENAKVLLFLGRVTPKKGLLKLIEAWAGARWQNANWHLVIVGPGQEGHLREVRSAIRERDVFDTVHAVGPAYGIERARSYASADAFILPSVSEGLPLAPLEALAYGMLALLTPQCNLPETFAAGCALEMQPDAASIEAALRLLFEMPEAQRRAMGQNGRKLVEEHFDWDAVAAQFCELYRQIS